MTAPKTHNITYRQAPHWVLPLCRWSHFLLGRAGHYNLLAKWDEGNCLSQLWTKFELLCNSQQKCWSLMRILQQDQVDIDENVLRRSSAKLVVTSVGLSGSWHLIRNLILRCKSSQLSLIYVDWFVIFWIIADSGITCQKYQITSQVNHLKQSLVIPSHELKSTVIYNLVYML